ncbi:16931_t:CDS:2 [Entrophospora sp. SA101]|nr:16931_t:CDS:2 [Entrophospora sp. SA101]
MVRKVASSTILYESKLLSIIIYSDATNCDNLGKTMKHLIYITLGNILKSSAVFKSAQRLAFMKSLKILFDPIYKQYEDGTILEINKSYIWCVLKLSFIISDLPEASAFCTTYKSYNSKLPYHTCLVEKENLNNMNLSSENILLQTPDHMKQNMIQVCTFVIDNLIDDSDSKILKDLNTVKGAFARFAGSNEAKGIVTFVEDVGAKP